MHYLVENPWPATYLFGGLAGACLLLLRFTQQGKYLIAGGVAAAVVGLAWGLDFLVVTDAERVEDVVYGLARAVRDAHPLPTPTEDGTPPPTGGETDRERIDRAMGFLAPDVSFDRGGRSLNSLVTQGMLRGLLGQTSFDSLNVTRLDVDVAEQARRATARFRVYASGSTEVGGTRYNFLTDAQGTEWELGLRETEPGVWKVTRITPIRLPGEAKYLGLPTGP